MLQVNCPIAAPLWRSPFHWEVGGYDPYGRIFSKLDHYPDVLFLSEDMVPYGKGGGGTNQGAGLELALNEMLIRGEAGSKWEMMLITDGEAYQPLSLHHHTYPRWPNGGHGTGPDGISAYTAEIAREICDKAINLPTIYYANPIQPALSAYLTNQVVCKNGHSTFSSTPNIHELQDLMEDVVKSIPIVFVR